MDYGLRVELLLIVFQGVPPVALVFCFKPHGVVDLAFLLEVALVTLVVASDMSLVSLVREGELRCVVGLVLD